MIGGPMTTIGRVLLAFGSFDPEHVAEAFFEEIGSPESRVGFGDPVELLMLAWVEVVGVLPQCVARPGDVSGVAGGPSPPARRRLDLAAFGLVPGSASFHVESLDRPSDNMERVGATDRIRGPPGHDAGDPVGHIS